jgi:hypothetical protein
VWEKYGINPFHDKLHEEALEGVRAGIQWDEGRAEYSEYYRLGRHYGAFAGAPQYTPLRRVSQWTLIIPESYELRWEETLWSYDATTHELVERL